jgi:hypothetical protein
MEPISLRTPLALLLTSLGMIAALWWWLATPITLARAPIDPEAKLQCVSYAPFRSRTPWANEQRRSARYEFGPFSLSGIKSKHRRSAGSLINLRNRRN